MQTISPTHRSVRGYDAAQAEARAARPGVSHLLAGLLVARGIASADAAQKLLHPSLALLVDEQRGLFCPSLRWAAFAETHHLHPPQTSGSG